MVRYDPNKKLFAADPKQAVLAHLSYHTPHLETAIFGTDHTPDMTSVQFLFECSIPHHQLHTIQYKNNTGERMRVTFMVVQNDEHLWYTTTAHGYRLDDPVRRAFQQQQAETLRPYAHLSAGGSPFSACGEVIENGYPVTKVHIKSHNGNALEETVQNGWVLVITDQEMPFPLEITLHDASDRVLAQKCYP